MGNTYKSIIDETINGINTLQNNLSILTDLGVPSTASMKLKSPYQMSIDISRCAAIIYNGLYITGHVDVYDGSSDGADIDSIVSENKNYIITPQSYSEMTSRNIDLNEMEVGSIISTGNYSGEVLNDIDYNTDPETLYVVVDENDTEFVDTVKIDLYASTPEEMESYDTEENVGKVVKYIGESNEDYTNNAIYLIS